MKAEQWKYRGSNEMHVSCEHSFESCWKWKRKSRAGSALKKQSNTRAQHSPVFTGYQRKSFAREKGKVSSICRWFSDVIY